MACLAVAREPSGPPSASGVAAFTRFASEMACLAVAREPSGPPSPSAPAWQPSLASRAKAGGEGRTRTFEVIRRLIYSQAGYHDNPGQIRTPFSEHRLVMLDIWAFARHCR